HTRFSRDWSSDVCSSDLLTFDWTCPEDLREQVPVIAGKEMDFTYGDLQVETDMINRAYIEVMTAGDAKGRVFTFPIPTYNMTPRSEERRVGNEWRYRRSA